jgi:hypothetical protein
MADGCAMAGIDVCPALALSNLAGEEGPPAADDGTLKTGSSNVRALSPSRDGAAQG